MSDLEDRITSIRARVDAACQCAGRDVASVRLVAVSKTVDETVVAEAMRLGLTHFGENRVQDATRKFAALSADGLSPHLHLIGQLQTNKARAAARIAHEIESVDRLNLIETLEAEARKLAERGGTGGRGPTAGPAPGQHRPGRTEVRVRSGGSPGADRGAPGGADARSARSDDDRALRADRGGGAPDVCRTAAASRCARRRYPEANLATLSMGMTNDFEVAIEEGSTSIRVGRAIFAPA